MIQFHLDNLQKMNFEEILEARKELEEYIDVIDEYVITSKTDLNGIITYSSKAFEKISGYYENELIGKPHNIVRHPDTPLETFQQMWDTIKQEKTWIGEIQNLRKDGTSYWVKTRITATHDHHGNHIGYTSIRQDITDKKKIEEVALTDELTNLYNRRYYNQIIQKEINRAIRDKKVFLYMIMDLDYFKMYNDNYGHQAGDKALQDVASFLKQYFKRATDISFRLGGEEFCIIYSTNTNEQGTQLAQKLCNEIEKLNIKHEYSEVSDHLTVSIGLAICDFSNKPEEIDSTVLYTKADKALYKAKLSGRNCVNIVEPLLD